MEPARDAETGANKPSVHDELMLVCPAAVLAICAFGHPPQADDIMWNTQIHLTQGGYGRISASVIPKRFLNPYFTEKSGRESTAGDYELITFKSPLRVVEPDLPDTRPDPTTLDEVETIPLREPLMELSYLANPQLLYHENIVDILGYCWEPVC